MVALNFNREFRNKDALSLRRKELLGDVVAFVEEGRLRKGFHRDFFSYLNDVSFQMLQEGPEYYAHFLGETLREIDFNLGFPTATVLKGSQIVFRFNPISFLYMETREAAALIKHEIFHLLLKHHSRERYLKSKFQKLAINLAMDIAVNQYISHLPPFVERIGSVNRRLDLNLKTNETLEFYVESIDQALREHPKGKGAIEEGAFFNYEEVHDAWVDSEEETDDEVRQNLKRVIKNAGKNGVPDEVLKVIQMGGKGEVPWTAIVKEALQTLPRGRKKTVTRVDRRQPERLDLRGELRNHEPDILVAFDISGSIDSRTMEGFLKEIFSLTQHLDHPIRVLECDDQVRRDYVIRGLKDIQPLLKRRGGTRFSPVFQHIKDKNLRGSLLIYFTDGKGEEMLSLKPVHHRTIWIVLGEKLSLGKPYGKVHYLPATTVVDDHVYGLKAMRALLHEWAR